MDGNTGAVGFSGVGNFWPFGKKLGELVTRFSMDGSLYPPHPDFSLSITHTQEKIPLIIVWMGIVFNVVNGFFNGYYLGFINQPQADALQWHFLCGLLLFAAGMVINIITDNKLIQLRRNGNGYSIPQGWLFRYISCPNHFGEIIEWAGFALVAWNFPAFSFALWTITNLLPRALNHHAWYKENFDTYPKERKAVIPLIV